MRHFFSSITQHLALLISYILTAVILVFLFPREGKFPYEFQKGRVWNQEDLYAPFDVPILKTPNEILAERDSLLKNIKPYYNYDSSIESQQLASFETVFKERWTVSPPRATGYASQLAMVDSLFHFVYQQGIVETIDPKLRAIGIIKNNISDTYLPTDIFTQKTAYEYITSHIEAREWPDIVSFLESLNLNTYIATNLTLNAETTERVQTEILNSISLTKGVIPHNHIVIAQGEVIDENNYNRLISLKNEYEHTYGKSANTTFILIGQSLLVMVLLLSMFIVLRNVPQHLTLVFKNNLFLLITLLGIVGCSFAMAQYTSAEMYVMPVLLVALLVRVFFDLRVAFIMHFITIFLVSFVVSNSFEYIFLNTFSGAILIVSLKNLYSRSAIFKSIVFTFMSYCLLYTALILLQGVSFSSIEWPNYIWFSINALLLLSSYPLIYICEKVFGFLSDVTLMELSDSNSPLLRKLSEVAPGTFQHSMQVANMAEEVIRKIGGNPLLARTGGMYHDIGKSVNPQYFTENQSLNHNPHDQLNPQESAGIIISHVTHGVELAKKA